MIRLPHIGIGAAILTLVPTVAYGKTFAEIVNGSIVPLGDKVVELMYALAFIFFLIGMVRYFFSQKAESRQQGKAFAIYGLVALAILFVVWGVVRFLISILSSFNT